MSYMAIQPTVRAPVLERTSKEAGDTRSDLTRNTRIGPLTLDLRSIHRSCNTHGLCGEVNASFQHGADDKCGTWKHFESPVEDDCLETIWPAETYEVATRAAKANRGANRIAKVGRGRTNEGAGIGS